MKIPAWIWQFPQDYPPEGSSFTHQGRNIPVIGPDDRLAPICDAYVKTHDGVYWMGDIYSHLLAPKQNNLDRLQAIYFDQGIEFTPWCVPKGLWPEPEAELACQALKVTNRLILDVEPYQWFWTGPWSNLHPYMEYIRARYPNAWIGLSFDPRYGQYGQYNVDKYRDIHFDEWLPYVDALLPQDYWKTFGVDAIWEISHTAARLEHLGKEVIHCIPGHAWTPAFEVAVDTIHGFGNRLAIWRRGTYSLTNAAYVAGIQEEPEEEDPCADLEAEVRKLRGLLTGSEVESRARLERIRRYESKLMAGAQALRNTANALERDDPYVV